MLEHILLLFFFFFNDTATTEIYTLSLHDALPIYLLPTALQLLRLEERLHQLVPALADLGANRLVRDRKSTRLNSSHLVISYAVFCLKKKKKKNTCYSDILYRHSERITSIGTASHN